MRNDWEFWRGAAAATGVAVITALGWHAWNAHRQARAAARWLRSQVTHADLTIRTRGRTIQTRPYDWRTDADLKEKVS